MLIKRDLCLYPLLDLVPIRTPMVIVKYKKESVLFLFFMVLVLLLFCRTPMGNTQTPQEIYQAAANATVLLVMKDTNDQTLGYGSGFFVEVNKIATNFHVIEGAARGIAKHVGQETMYTIEGFCAVNEKRDLAVLQVSASSVQPLTIADSDAVEIGEKIYVVGNPKGYLEGTFSEGIISGIRLEETDKLLQLTAPISPGSSGGPVLNNKAEVIGISVATIKGGQNLNFAIPSNFLKDLLTELHSVIPFPSAAEPIPKACDGNVARVRKILAAAADAHGGLENLKQVKTFVSIGEIVMNTPAGEMTMDGELTVVLPSKARNDMTIPAMGMTMSRVLGEGSAWIASPQGTQTMPEAFVAEGRNEIFRLDPPLLTYVSGAEVPVQHLGEEDVNGKMADVILVRDTPAGSIKLFIDQESKHIVKKAYQALGQQGEPVQREEFPGDYRDISGVKVAFSIVLVDDGEKVAEVTLSEATINAEVDESVFEQ